MSSFTKRAIIESFLHIAGKKPLEKITVRDIVDDCGINRNTFYYYFQDIYAVLEEICHAAISKVPEGLSLADALLAFFDVFVDFSHRHPRVARTLLISQGYEGIERYFSGDFDALILDCLSRGAGKNAPRSFLQTTVSFVRHAFFGAVLDWLRAEHRLDVDELKRQLACLLCALERAQSANIAPESPAVE